MIPCFDSPLNYYHLNPELPLMNKLVHITTLKLPFAGVGQCLISCFHHTAKYFSQNFYP